MYGGPDDSDVGTHRPLDRGTSYPSPMAAQPTEVLKFLFRSSKRIAITVVGGAVLLLGLALLFAPGPGFLVVVIGFAILGTEYAWAAAALERTKKTAERASQMAKEGISTAGRGAAGAASSVSRRFRRR